MPGWPGIGEFLLNVEEWIERSNGKLRADAAHDKLLALGFAGSSAVCPCSDISKRLDMSSRCEKRTPC